MNPLELAKLEIDSSFSATLDSIAGLRQMASYLRFSSLACLTDQSPRLF